MANASKDQINEGSQEHNGVLAFYKSLPDAGGACALIFDRGDYYSVHGKTAHLAAATVFHTNAVIKKRGYGSNEVDTVFLNRSNFETFVRELLLVKQYRVVIYRQQTPGKNDWHEEFKASPGNLAPLEDILFGGSCDQNTNSGIMAVKVATDAAAHKIVGVGFIDVSSRTFRVSQFTDTDVFANLEALIVQLGPKECLLPTGEAGSRLAKCIERSGVLITERKRSEFSSSDTEQDLSHLVRGWGSSGVAARPELEKEHAVAALEAAVRYLELTSNEGNFNQFRLSVYELSQFMRLDAAALKALHVETNPGAGGQLQHNSTLLAVLDRCRTGPGHRMMARWLRQPLLDINKIEERLDLVSALTNSVELRNSVSEQHLKRVPDLPRIARRLAKGQATLQDCHRLYQCAEGLPGLCESIARYEGPHNTVLAAVFTTPLQDSISDLVKFQEMIETTVDLDQARLGQYVIKPDFDEELSAIRCRLDSLTDNINGELRSAANDLGLEAGKTIKLEHNGHYGYFFRVTLKEEKCLRNNRMYHMLDTNKAGVRFRNNAVTDLNKEHAEQLKMYERQQAGVVGEILNIASGYVEVIQSLSSVLTTLDCVCALAVAAVSAPVPYVRPTILPSGASLSLSQCRHPCLEMIDTVSYIPNDTNMGQDKGGKFEIITGPNMGGKSTYLRAVATAVLMAQVGSFVPCDVADVPVMDAILTRVGAGDCQQKGVSTFMAEMIETATILKTASSNSLIIIDELGRGTSTYDGFGLAWAISDHIARELNSFCLFATHFHELTALADVLPDTVTNRHVAAATGHDTLTLLYMVLPGPCDRSFGIHCAKIAHFPEKVVQCAKRKAEELEDDFGAVLDDSEEGDTVEAINNRRKQKKEGDKLIARVLSKAAALNEEGLSDEQLEAALTKLRTEVDEESNAYTSHLLASAC